MKRLVAHALAIAIGACAGIAAAQLNGGVMESQRLGAAAITSGAINATTIGATTPSTGSFTTLTASSTFQATGAGPHAIGSSTYNDTQQHWGGSFTTGSTHVQGVYQDSTYIPAVNGNAHGVYLNPTLNKAGSGTHADFTTLNLSPPVINAGAATLTNATTLKIGGAPSVGTNLRALWVAAGISQFDGGVKGSATNDAATAGNVGELLTTTVASGSAVSLTTATSANIATLSLTAGDWDCAGQVDHNAAATTSITLLQVGISATTATLPTQAGGSGIGTDPLSIWRQAAAVPGGVLSTQVGPVRVTLAGTTNIFLVANDTFTVSTMTAYGTIRCRRMR